MMSIFDYKTIYGDSRLMYFVSEEDVQFVAQLRIGRNLTEDELLQVEKGIHAGLSISLDSGVLSTAIDEAVKG